MALLRERGTAGCTLKPPFFGMDCPDVLAQVSLPREAPITHGADVRPVPTVGTFVGPDVAGVSAGVRAEATPVIPPLGLARVCFVKMVSEERPGSERYVAQRTFERRWYGRDDDFVTCRY